MDPFILAILVFLSFVKYKININGSISRFGLGTNIFMEKVTEN